MLVTLRGLATGAEPLGLPALGGLFAADQCPDLDAAELPNKALLAAVRALCFFRAGAVLARINYRDMDTEELGSVYESLLELQPAINVDANPWRFGFIGDEAEGEARGSARKLTGSYYTPDELVQELIKSALEPKIAERSRRPIRVPRCSPSRSSTPPAAAATFCSPPPAASPPKWHGWMPKATSPRRSLPPCPARGGGALHLRRGLNPMAVELCQTALWLETLEPGKPLGFLDHHIRHGNSLVGILDPAIMKEGIPDEAYTALSGDDKTTCTALKRSNRTQAGGRQPNSSTPKPPRQLADTHAALDAMPEDTVDAIAAKRAAFAQPRPTQQLARERLRCRPVLRRLLRAKDRCQQRKGAALRDLVRAAEGQPMRAGVAELTARTGRGIPLLPLAAGLPRGVRAGRLRCRAGQSAVGTHQAAGTGILRPAQSGDRHCRQCGRPHPADRGAECRHANPADKRLYRDFIMSKRGAEGTSLFAHESGRFPLTGVGDVNLYALFAETSPS